MISTDKILIGQRAIVTGANSGIGEAIAKGLAAAGAQVLINYVAQPEKAEAVAEDIRSKGGAAMTFQADVSNETGPSHVCGYH
jgi:glucose 1-dehydrogenase